MKNLKHIYIIFLFFYSTIALTSFAQSDVIKGSFVHPSIMELNEYKHEFSLVLAKLPEDAIESTSAWIYAPLFTYSAKYGLPYAFNLKGGFSSNIITYQLRTGLQWGYNFNRITFSINSDAAYWFGRLNRFGFNSEVSAWSGYSNLSLGIEFDKFTLTIQTESEYIISIKQKADDVVTNNKNSYLAGSSFAIFIEQPAWGDNYMTLGIRFNYTNLYWPAWAVFPSWDRYMYIPEVIIGFVL
ncbi:MAG: hypothetical protein ABFS12_13075 [Bacteroidota bacterium]